MKEYGGIGPWIFLYTCSMYSFLDSANIFYRLLHSLSEFHG
jgi:hypothetical protein